jgi:sugar O-acyltransferase (sialic acid O-acetyltransferase NeuD family)
MPGNASSLRLQEKVVWGLQGTGGCARGIMPLLLEAAKQPDIVCVYVEPEPRQRQLNGVPVLSDDEFIALECRDKSYNVGIADPHIRERITARYAALGMTPLVIRAASAVVFDHSIVGEGAVISPFALIAANTRIGRMLHLNIHSYIEHDCLIGDYVTFAPGVRCNGNVHIGDRAYIGSGAVIRQGTAEKPLTIGEEAVVGMGAVVTRDVAPGTVVIGNPARPMQR